MTLGRILKYPLTLDAEQRLTVPAGSRVLALQPQDGVPTLWLLTSAPVPHERVGQEEWQLRCVGTGWDARALDEWTHLGTTQDGAFVWHWFRQERP